MSVATSTTNGHREVGKPRLKRSMGLWMATALVVGNMVGSGIFTLPAVLAGEAGPASILALVFTGIGAMLLALVFANLGRAHPHTGGPYYFARRAFGDFVGFQTAWAYWIAAWVGNAAIAVAFAGYLGVFWGDVNTTNWLAALVAIGAIWLFTLVNILGARETGVAQVLTTVLKFVPLAVIGLIGLFYIKGGNYTPFTPADRRLRLAHQRRRDAGALGLHRARVGDRAGRGGQGPREDDSSGDDPRHARDDAALPGGADRDRRRPVAGRARRLVGALCRRGECDLGRNVPGPELGQVDRPGRHGGDPRRSERLDHADRPRLDGGGGRRPLPEAVCPRARRAPDPGLRARSSRPSWSADWCSTTGTPASRIASRTSSCSRPG